MPQNEPPELQELTKASAGLLYPSESDEPFDALAWPGGTAASARQAIAAHVGPGRKIQEVPVDRFFADLRGADDAGRFDELRRVLESNLDGLSVFRVGDGEVQVDIYLIGKTRAGDWTGLHTVSIET